METVNNMYDQKVLHIDMERLAVAYKKPKREIFRSLMLAQKVLTNNCTMKVYEDWITSLKELHGLLINDDDKTIIYKVLAILFRKYSSEISRNKHNIDQIMDETGLDPVQFYTHFCDDDMKYMAIQSKAMDMLEKRNEILLDIAENSESDSVRVAALKALDTYIVSALEPQSPKSINVYGQALIDNSQGKSVKAFDIDKLMGQGDESFKNYIRNKIEVDDIKVTENGSSD